jgi:two-component system, LytTR family, response regulator LytT
MIVDDEKLARSEMRYLLEAHDDITVIGEASNGQEAVESAELLTPDLLLLDVQMPGMSGFEVVNELADRDALPFVVFVTAYDEYAVKAFEVSAVDYVLKPVEDDRLAIALDRVRSRTAPSGDELVSMLRTISRSHNDLPPKISVRKGDRYLLLNPADITHCHILDGVVFVSTRTASGITTHRTLDELHADLDPEVFWRVHRGHIVNINHVTEIVPAQSGTYRLRIDGGDQTEVPLSRAQARRLRRVLRW